MGRAIDTEQISVRSRDGTENGEWRLTKGEVGAVRVVVHVLVQGKLLGWLPRDERLEIVQIVRSQLQTGWAGGEGSGAR